MTYLIQALGFIRGVPCPHAYQYLESFDHNAYEGQGYGTFTPDPNKAMKFDRPSEAFEFFLRPSTITPLRGDGGFNRPLTCLIACFVKLDDALQRYNHQADQTTH